MRLKCVAGGGGWELPLPQGGGCLEEELGQAVDLAEHLHRAGG